jgi:TonB-dependent starch-binding outer membrane protein SusC
MKPNNRNYFQKTKWLERLLFTVFLLTSVFGFTYAQEKTITGKVVDESGLSVPGATIIVKGTTTGTVSDVDGKFTIGVPPSTKTLLISFVGMKAQEIQIGNQTNISVILISESIGLNEVVAIGYSTATRRNVASAIAKISEKEIVGLSVTDANQILQGKMAGVQVIDNSGDPGAGARITIRGVGSFTNSDPLYVIDGIQGGNINSIPAQDMESITVLKDASSTAIYGSAAANGVVIITTKRGKKGKIQVEYEGSLGVASVSKRYNMLNATQDVDLIADVQAAANLPLTDKLKTSDVRITRTDWQKEVFRNASINNHNIRIFGGGENSTYSFSAGYQNHESTVIDRDFQRASFGFKLDQTLLNKKVRFSENLRIKNDVNKGVLANFNDALRMPPYLPVLDPTNLGGYSRADKISDLQDSNNPLNAVHNTNYQSRSLDSELELNAEIDLFSGLTAKSQTRFSSGNYHDINFNYPSNGGNFIKTTADMSENFNYYYSMILENFFNYNKQFGDHLVSATLGNTYSPSNNYRSVAVAGSNYTSTSIENVALANSNSITGATVNSGKARLSYFTRAGYTYKERYVLNVSTRRDASSVFGANNRWGTFYGVGLGWSVSEEEFMKPISAISNLKIRSSYGKTGNDNIAPFLTTQNLWKGSSNNIVYSFGDGTPYSIGSTVNSIANPNLKWEETTQYDLGIDFGFLKNKLNFTFDYYHRDNKDLLINTTLPLTTGLGLPGQNGTLMVNAASMKNTGLESTISYIHDSGKIKWDFTGNLTFSTNKVTALGTLGNNPISNGEFIPGIGNSTRTDIGHPLASYYGYKVDHVAVSQAEVDLLNAATSKKTNGAVTEYITGLKPGDFIYKDITGDGYVDAKDRTYIGNPSPKWQYGGVVNAYFKNIDVQMQFQGITGVSAVNGNKYWFEGMTNSFNQTTDVLRRWKKDGDVTDMPAAAQNSGTNMLFSTWYVENGAYFRMKNVAIGYTLPKDLLNNTFTKLRFYVAIQNLFTLTKYKGYDPEISSSSPTDSNNYIFQRGIDMTQHPNPTTYRIGLQLNF